LLCNCGAALLLLAAGLLLAWPRPLEQVVILPSPDRVLEHHVATLLRSQQALQADRSASKENPVSDALAGSGYLLTGDAGVVQLDVRVFYRVVDPYDYVLQRDHITPGAGTPGNQECGNRLRRARPGHDPGGTARTGGG
jgi:regulator of protease activity HflC (stomatin/prohibitin superfamily)